MPPNVYIVGHDEHRRPLASGCSMPHFDGASPSSSSCRTPVLLEGGRGRRARPRRLPRPSSTDRIAQAEGREKQIGHSFLLDGTGRPISDTDEFAAQFRHEILPLLQEYAFDDYRELESYVGKGVVDVDGQRIRPGLMDDSQALIDALVAGFNQAAVTDGGEQA